MKKNGILRFYLCFQWAFGRNQAKYAIITITHVCFIALTLAGSLLRCLNTQPNSFLGNHKTMLHVKTCVIPICPI